ncbi:hypothetical protein GLAREA_12443 [Glarea lozoyensis ATCC 20868]|uniref:DUF6536 domain-containing protein n=1 Tax=Glarea lozoyensis (strain ATCC 20868 / MF5171) TaxID=1116229 RepID=S3CZI7_GLAL2|nr:uncharacterized protein GLAREA_12443 [Glarea lozoyensis ATCC 20868]EPE31687.1 hypothetical protein GLAREA_12443 [Glarea lozoyensis ATCC 20868]
MTTGPRDDQRESLLRNAASLTTSTPSPGGVYGHEMVDFGSGDIGMRRTSYPPAYEPSVQRDHGRDGSFGRSSMNKDLSTRQIQTESIRSGAPSVIHNAYHRFMRFILRSGTWGSHINYKPANSGKQPEDNEFSGWRGGIAAACAIAGTVLTLNIVFCIYGGAVSKSGMKIGSLYEGDCDTVTRADSALHIAINIMATLLLGASNYTMQCISSPTRREIDRAHARGKYLDIGIPSIRNLSGRRKHILFWLLVVSSVPLHFLWNSAVFTTTQEIDYKVAVVTPSFLESNNPINCSLEVSPVYSAAYNKIDLAYDNGPIDGNKTKYYQEYNRTVAYYPSKGKIPWYQLDACPILTEMRANATQNLLTRLSTTECINKYGTTSTRLAKVGHVLAVTKPRPENDNSTVLFQFNFQTYISNITGNNWVCGPRNLIANNYKCSPKTLAGEASWTLGRLNASTSNPYRLAELDEWEIDHCLALETDIGGKCMLQVSMVIMTFVIIANAIKFTCIIWVIKTSTEPVLATIGDGISSFLQRPDPITADRPFLTRPKARKFRPLSAKYPEMWTSNYTNLRWWKGPSKARWFITLTLCIIAIISTCILLGTGNENFKSNVDIAVSNPYSIGFGVYNKAATVTIFAFSDSDVVSLTKSSFDSSKNLLQMVGKSLSPQSVANIPQFIVSSLYFAYNTIYTSMHSAAEFSHFTLTRKALRTTRPLGAQRSTYWLSLPWTYSLPLAIASMTLHFLISASLFIARTEILDPSNAIEPISYMQVGYSPLAILLAVIFGSLMVLAMILNGFRKLDPGLLVGNNSLAIAAACQRPEWDSDAHLRAVRWGVVRAATDGRPGHCALCSGEVEVPKLAKKYI